MKKNYFLLSMILLGIDSFAQEYKMPVSSVTSKQEAQSGNEATFSADGILTTMYHSKWNQNGIPDQLDFSFNSQVKSIKSLAYFPRQTGTNGISISSNNFLVPTFSKIGWKCSFNWKVISASSVAYSLMSSKGTSRIDN